MGKIILFTLAISLFGCVKQSVSIECQLKVHSVWDINKCDHFKPEIWTSSLYRITGSTHVFSAANTGHCLGYLTTIAPAYSWTNKIHDK